MPWFDINSNRQISKSFLPISYTFLSTKVENYFQVFFSVVPRRPWFLDVVHSHLDINYSANCKYKLSLIILSDWTAHLLITEQSVSATPCMFGTIYPKSRSLSFYTDKSHIFLLGPYLIVYIIKRISKRGFWCSIYPGALMEHFFEGSYF